MIIEDVKECVENCAMELDAEMRRMVRQAGPTQAFDLERYGLLRSLDVLLIAADATCASILNHQEKKGVPA